VAALWPAHHGDPQTLRLTFDRSVTHAAVPTLTATGGAVTATYSAGSGSAVLQYTLSRGVSPTEAVTLALTANAATAAGVGNAPLTADVLPFGMAHHGEGFPLRLGAARTLSAQSGFWDETTTWVGGVVPTAGTDVVIAGHTVTLRNTNAACRSVMVYTGGHLKFATDATTELVADDVFVLDDGVYEMGSSSARVDASHTATLTFRDTALPDRYVDPLQLGRGLIAMDTSTVRFGGAARRTRADQLRVTTDPMAGHTSVTLEFEPTGWRVGDRIAILSTEPVYHFGHSESFGFPFRPEERTITGISGSVVSFAAPLEDDHAGAYDLDGTPRFRCHVINPHRNVVVRSANPAGTRGHVLFTGRVAVEAEYVFLDSLGRTANHAGPEPDSGAVAANGLLTKYGPNQKGRYAWHLHHCSGPVATDPLVSTLTFGGTVTGGTFRLMYVSPAGRSQQTAEIAWSATPATLRTNIQAALDSLFGAGQVTVTGSGPFTLTSAGTVPQFVAVLNRLTGTDADAHGDYQYRFKGLGLRDGRKWGVAVHDTSFVRFDECNVHDCTAAALSLEIGTEVGCDFVDCSFTDVHGGPDDAVANGLWMLNLGWHRITRCVLANVGQYTTNPDSGLQYLGHLIHADYLQRGGVRPGGGALVKVPLYRGANVGEGADGVEYRSVSFGTIPFAGLSFEGYATFKGMSFDHGPGWAVADQPQMELGPVSMWAYTHEFCRSYGGAAPYILRGFTLRKFVYAGMSIDTWGARIELTNGDVQTDTFAWAGGFTPIGLWLSGGADRNKDLVVTTATVRTPRPVLVAFPGSGPQATSDIAQTRQRLVLTDCVLVKPGGSTAGVVTLQSDPGALNATAIPMALAQVFVHNHQAVSTDDFQAYWDGQAADAPAVYEADITFGGPGVTKYGATAAGRTNAQEFAASGRATGGELMPAGATTRAWLTGGKAVAL
jgi:hypothetical protein